MDDRIALIGANGNGKSTMMKMLAGRLMPEAGKLVKSKKLKVGYFAQHQSEELNPDGSAFDHISERQPMDPPARLRGHLGRFGFVQERADTKVQNLSGGEKARLLFALMSLEKPHIMLLDEPTNHLDIDSREALVEALNFYEGAVILVSHDVHLVSLVADNLWLVNDGKCKIFDGNIDEYEKLLLEKRSIKKTSEKVHSKGPIRPKENKKEQRRLRAEERAETANMRKNASFAEKEIEKLTLDIKNLEEKMSGAAFYKSTPIEISKSQRILGRLKKNLSSSEATWLKLHDTLDTSKD
jgi:ATP-binding cassette subfamily F protein 3